MPKAKVKHKRTRSKFTEDRKAKICEALELGSTFQAAASYAGIAASTLHYWVSKGASHIKEDIQSEFSVFHDRVEISKNAWQVDALKKIMKAGQDDVRHLQWMLTKKFPKEFGSHQNITADIKADINLDSERLATILANAFAAKKKEPEVVETKED